MSISNYDLSSIQAFNEILPKLEGNFKKGLEAALLQLGYSGSNEGLNNFLYKKENIVCIISCLFENKQLYKIKGLAREKLFMGKPLRNEPKYDNGKLIMGDFYEYQKKEESFSYVGLNEGLEFIEVKGIAIKGEGRDWDQYEPLEPERKLKYNHNNLLIKAIDLGKIEDVKYLISLREEEEEIFILDNFAGYLPAEKFEEGEGVKVVDGPITHAIKNERINMVEAFYTACPLQSKAKFAEGVMGKGRSINCCEKFLFDLESIF